MKDQEIYNIFNTEKILNRPAEVAISNTSGTAGIAYWINKHYKLGKDGAVTKQDPIVIKIKEEIDRLYADGRTTLMGDDELEQIINFYYPRLRSTCAE
jgi:isopropylmalate/homocitrate/citramalate synthase